MTRREHAEELRLQAIQELLAERQAIDEQLKTLGYDKEKAAPQKRRGRPPKATATQSVIEAAEENENSGDSAERNLRSNGTAVSAAELTIGSKTVSPAARGAPRER